MHRIVNEIPSAKIDHPVIIATGPLTGDELAADIAKVVGSEHLAYFDAIAPIVAADSIDWDRVWKQSRWGKGDAPEGDIDANADDAKDVRDNAALGDASYVNCAFDEEGYKNFVRAVNEAEKVEPKDFEKTRHFEGCLPIEVMASRGEMTLAFGPMKPIGLVNPKTGKRPFAVVQLRPEDHAATAYNLVGFQTKMAYKAQERVLRMIPGLEQAEFMRMGSVHRNTFLDSPRLLDGTMQLRSREGLYLRAK